MQDPLEDTITYLRSPVAIRERCRLLFQLAQAGRLRFFTLHLDRLPQTVSYVLKVIEETYPDGLIPFHSRWRHFEVDCIPRLEYLKDWLAGCSPVELARTQVDLAVVSVLLDAGAGGDWAYYELSTERTYCRSEGLAVASFHSFCEGLFSSDNQHLLQADAAGLEGLTQQRLATSFQVTSSNPLVGLEGRVQLLQRLGRTLREQPQWFGEIKPRPGGLVDYLLLQGSPVSAVELLKQVVVGFGSIWPGRVALAGVPLGDVWPHSLLANESPGGDLVPFHKLSQWLTYSLLEPLQDLGLVIANMDALTGLAEYRNGGLCLDLGLISLRDPALAKQVHLPGSELVVEWRALTLCLLDEIALGIQAHLGLTAAELPLVKVLQGGTWAAGRRIAAERRLGGAPPLQIESDGTVF